MKGAEMIDEWERLAEQFSLGGREEAVHEARLLLRHADRSVWQWMSEALEHEQPRWFVAAVFRTSPVPKHLFEPLLMAAVNADNPSFNNQFVEPCIRSFGHRAVNEFLLALVEGNDNALITGAVAALYWAKIPLRFSGDVPAYTLQHATPESQQEYLKLTDVWRRKAEAYLRIFVTNEDLDVRRQIIPQLRLDESAYPDHLKPFVQRAIDIARSHPDEYIRHRVEVQLGNVSLLRPIPPRQSSG
jgi:hypothetical protein